ncbi:MAG: ABC transporter permease [Methylococcaceae bacterium]|nr:ABC transporter permease [Methylococcaceae bacterium]
MMKPVQKKYYKKPLKPEIRRTKSAGGNFIDKLHAYRDQHAQALFSSLGRLVASPFTSLMTITVLAIAISLASGFYLLVINLQQVAGNLKASDQISLFLRYEISDSFADKFAETIKRNPNVQQVKLISRKEALEEFKTFSGFGSAIDVMESNPLPIVVQVTPKMTLDDKGSFQHLLESFKQAPEVDIAQVDMQWLERLELILEVARRGATLLSGLLGIGVLFIIGNTIRLELHNRRDEVIIAKLVGATNAFIQRPFLYSGFWIGFISGVAAWFIVTGMMLLLWQSVDKLSRLYGGTFHMLFLSFSETLTLLLISSLLGILGAWGVLVYQLRHTKPV